MAAHRKPVRPPAEQTPLIGPADVADKFRFFFDKVSPWVSAGSVYGFPMHEEMTEPTILEGESSIGALTTTPTGVVLGITTGRRGHLFYFHHSFYVVDLGVLGEGVTGGAIVTTLGDKIVGGWRGQDGGLFRHDARHELGTGQEDFYSRKAPVERLSLPGKGEGVLALVYNPTAGATYGLTTSNRIISLADDARKVRVEVQADARLAPALLRLPDGRLLGACEEGQLWTYRPGTRAIEKTGAFAPCEKGKRYVASVQSLLLTRNGVVYGGSGTDGFFFSFDPATGALLNFGKPHRQSFIRALTEGHDGLIYGVVEEPKGMAHLFTFDPAGRVFEDLGILNTFIPVQWSPHSIGALCTGIHGEIYAGESDTISHLFVYYPPVVRRTGFETAPG